MSVQKFYSFVSVAVEKRRWGCVSGRNIFNTCIISNRIMKRESRTYDGRLCFYYGLLN